MATSRCGRIGKNAIYKNECAKGKYKIRSHSLTVLDLPRSLKYRHASFAKNAFFLSHVIIPQSKILFGSLSSCIILSPIGDPVLFIASTSF